MPAKAITLDTMHFERRGDAVKYLKSMLRKYDVGDKVSDADAKILKAALEHHPNAIEKIGCGISHFSVRTADFGTTCFWLNRIDGTTDKFSVTSSIHAN